MPRRIWSRPESSFRLTLPNGCNVDKRLADMEKRFAAVTWMIGLGFVIVTTLTTVFALLG